MAEFGKFTVKIEDDFDLEKIAACGQCFRARIFGDGTYRFIKGGQAVYLKKLQENDYAVCCAEGAWEEVWTDYFDLSRDYRSIRKNAGDKNRFVDRAVEAGTGIRILRQDAWEMLITFIISQRKNIPAISKAVEGLAAAYGKKLTTPYEDMYAFPSPEELGRATEEGLNACGLGYRTAYVRDAAEKVLSGELDLASLAACSDEELFTRLLKVHGVGKKVANCVCLFGYGRTSRVPVDVWISRAIQEECQGYNVFEEFRTEAGIIQQYVFYYERNLLKSATV